MARHLLRKLEQHITAGYRHDERRRPAKAVVEWAAAWKLLKRLVRPDMRSPEDFDCRRPMRTERIEWYSTVYPSTLRDLCREGKAPWDACLRLCREWLECFPEPIDDLTLAFILACQGESLAGLGRRDQAVRTFENAFARLPDHPFLKAQYDQIILGKTPEPTTYHVSIPLLMPHSTP